METAKKMEYKSEGEVVYPLIRLEEGDEYVATDSETFVITSEHTLSDVLRFLIEQSDIEEIKTIIDIWYGGRENGSGD